jgi:hypothetical protein
MQFVDQHLAILEELSVGRTSQMNSSTRIHVHALGMQHSVVVEVNDVRAMPHHS